MKSKVVSLCQWRDEKRHERARVALLRARNTAEPLRSLIADAEEIAQERFYGVCNAYRSYAA